MRFPRRSFWPLLLVWTIAACGSAGDGSAEGNTSDTSDDVSVTTLVGDSGAESGNATVSDHGVVQFQITGSHDISGEWAFLPEASYFDGDNWALTFTDPSSDGAVLISMNLNPDVMNIQYADPDFGIAGHSEVCTIEVDHQDAGGASGSFECPGVPTLEVDGSAGVVDFSGTFDARK